MSKKNYLEPIAIGIAGVISSNTISIWEKITTSNVLILILTGVTAILVYEIIVLLFNKVPKKYTWSRKIVDSRAEYEGFYLEIKNINSERCYAIVCLSYDIPTDEYKLSGVSIGQDGTIGINWTSNFVKIDTIKQKIIYAQTGHLTHSTDGKIFDGVTYMNFEYFPNGKPISGIGHFIDTIPAKSDFYFQKITEKDCEEYLKKKRIENSNDYRILVKEFHKTNSDKFFSWE